MWDLRYSCQCSPFDFCLMLSSLLFCESNKIVCGCGAKICYFCRNLITDPSPYAHFCQTPHCQHQECNKCPLYTKDAEDDARAMLEAGVQAAERVREQLMQEVSTTGRPPVDVNIDVNAILKQPTGNQQPIQRL